MEGRQSSLSRVGLLQISRFNNGNLHLQMREDQQPGNGIFSYCGSLLQRRRFHLKPGKPPTKSACSQGVISIIRAGGKAWLHSEAGAPTPGDAFY